MGGLGVGAIGWVFIMEQLINPDGLNPTVIVKEGEFSYPYFIESVANNVPTYWMVVGLNMLFWTLLVTPFIQEGEGTSGRWILKIKAKWHQFIEKKKELNFMEAYYDNFEFEQK